MSPPNPELKYQVGIWHDKHQGDFGPLKAEKGEGWCSDSPFEKVIDQLEVSSLCAELHII